VKLSVIVGEYFTQQVVARQLQHLLGGMSVMELKGYLE
jgi:hypothetical protein